jgi:curved DNA-binding protein CbpA
MDLDVISQWLNVLDTLSYYDLLRLQPDATVDDLKRAFYAFANDFHPDVHGGRPRQEREAIGVIFKRGTEAYRILSNPALRARYDQALLGGVVRPQSLSALPPAYESTPPAAGRLVDQVRIHAARPFVLRAEELLKKGDPKQAKIQLTLAMHMDAHNPALEELLKEIEAQIAARAEAERKKWQKPGT